MRLADLLSALQLAKSRMRSNKNTGASEFLVQLLVCRYLGPGAVIVIQANLMCLIIYLLGGLPP